jgi:peptide/nickel transport system substrate-binding protein
VKLSLRERLLPMVGVLLAVTVVAAACGGGTTNPADTEEAKDQLATGRTIPAPEDVTTGGTLRYGLSGENSFGWDPTSSPWFASAQIVSRAVFDRLAAYDENDVPQPYLAEAIEPNADFTQWTIRLRPGIIFHNGDPLDAAAVVANFERSKSSFLIGPAVQAIDSVTILDELSLRVDLSVSWATFPTSLTSQLGTIAAPAQFASDAPSQNPIGTGPFVWKGGDPIKVERNDSYWQRDASGRQLPYLDGITFSVIGDSSSRSASLKSGSVDVIEMAEAPQMRDLAQAAQAGEFQMFTNASREGAVQFVGLNTAKEPFDDLLARQLLAAAFDRQFISDELYLGLYPPAKGLFPPDSPFFYEDSYPGFDPVRAEALHEEYKTKYGKPLSFTVTLPSEPYYKLVGEAAQESARQFGIDMQIELVDVAGLLDKALKGNYEATGFVTFGDPNIDRIFITSETVQPLGSFALNFTRMDDPLLTEALNEARATDDLAVQVEQWRTVQERLAENLNLLYVVRARGAVVYTDNVFGLLQPPLPDGQTSQLSISPFFAYAWLQS